ncbi:hypothetical protein COT94_01655 [Candidatus Falkowbacteria bacterium CG10_big_fil_rev_8_21_14_0_10_37_14]|uniref:Uncharacterized protein n=1 Tax=Candidatus Falkowbacteria bacterium CG10_big_fil_rev_8_21_14_0_10_37_14 TaxID=1974561 RepID=A0A2M6WU07_9BACT|nr:hypothetical protein [Candidatus Falkowbacteria bacterium]PIT96206.1 MAG: hypothetical protein COT94_01655 [Candidatus Falkowbacteria bacterium CG10_big_fil_rev_8_21_14_0_10_37_14]
MPKKIDNLNLDKSKTAKTSGVSNEQLAELIKEDLVIDQEVLRLTKKLHTAMVVGQVMFWVKLLLIVVPLVAAYFFLPPLINDLMAQYKSLLR